MILNPTRRLPNTWEGALRASGLRGLGCGCSSIDENGDCMDPNPCQTYGPTDQQLLTPTPSPVSTPPSGSPFPWASLANTLTSDFSTIFKTVQPVPAGCTQITGPGGQSYVSCSGTPTAPQPGSLNFGGSSLGSGTLLIGALVLGGLFLARGKG